MKFRIEGGRIFVLWWTEETADFICSLCGQCGGWRRRAVELSYNLSLPPCPIASRFCG